MVQKTQVSTKMDENGQYPKIFNVSENLQNWSTNVFPPTLTHQFEIQKAIKDIYEGVTPSLRLSTNQNCAKM